MTAEELERKLEQIRVDAIIELYQSFLIDHEQYIDAMLGMNESD